ncbi:hypothetical protein FGO68_gene6802 [Halteria grandinella]|uniref:Heat shock protein 70 n=1 Tax=Halteria grandinella TaxID=5974 RepID=A0A8J8T5W2_HALGN|nr:hypothetical protein FGO68_gene6802 [Halteria grandinella]
MGPVIGIDLGTAYSCVGIFKNGRVEIIPNEYGNRITPSFVAWTDEERLVGEAAKNQAHLNPERSVYVVKRLIGRGFEDKQVQRDMKWLPYAIVNKNGKPYVKAKVEWGEEKKLSPEEISAMILIKMKEIAENYLGTEVKYAVITVPAYFNDQQRQATKDAGLISGLEVLRIINEATAAAIAYGMDKKQGEKNIIVIDLGGGTIDVSLLTIDNDVFEVVATSGDTHLGGEDFDQRLTEHFVKIFKKKSGKDIKDDPRSMQKLKSEVEKAKRDLSSIHKTKITIENLIDGVDFSEIITRARFEELCNDLFKKIFQPVQQVLDDSGMKKIDIDDVVLVGGSTRIPKVQQLIKDFFDGKEPNRGINPDEAIAYGAAIQGGILGDQTSEETKDILIIDVTPLTLGIETVGGVMTKITPRGTVLPAKKSQTFTTYQDQQTTVTISVFEGERAQVKDNYLLGKFDLTGIRPAARGVPQIEVTFEIDENSILSVTAKDINTTNQVSIIVKNENGRLSKEEIEDIIRENEKIALLDKKIYQIRNAKDSFEDYFNFVRNQLDEKVGKIIQTDDKYKLKDALLKAFEFLHYHPNSRDEDFAKLESDLRSVCDPIIAKANKQQHMGTSQCYCYDDIVDL